MTGVGRSGSNLETEHPVHVAMFMDVLLQDQLQKLPAAVEVLPWDILSQSVKNVDFSIEPHKSRQSGIFFLSLYLASSSVIWREYLHLSDM